MPEITRRVALHGDFTTFAMDALAADWLISEGHQPSECGLRFDPTVLLKDKSGHPLRSMPYRITLESGRTIEGNTDSAGCTEKVYSNSA